MGIGKMIRIWAHKETGRLVSDEKRIYNDPLYPTNLVYDLITKIVYYKFTQREDIDQSYFPAQKTRVGFMAPYIGPNGKFCKFEDNEIVEI